MNFKYLQSYLEKPAPFTPGEPLFWDDPHISAQMLKTHLDPNTDLAGRRPETIDRSVAWLVETLGLQPDDSILDLGCGPGLYAARLAEHGMRITGIDYSRRSIAYAQEFARDHQLEIKYRCQDYLTLVDQNLYDAVLLIYGDYCPLSPEQRKTLLANILRALKPGGHFVFDVTRPEHHLRYGSRNSWYLVDSGFWKPGPHLVLEDGFAYPEEAIYLDQAIVIEDSGKISVYRNWFQDFTLEAINSEVTEGGFAVQSFWDDLTGTPYSDESGWIGIVARKP